MIHIEEITQVTDELMDAFRRLVPQLSSTNPAPTVDEVAQMVNSPATVVLVARDMGKGQGAIVGSLTLAMFRIPTGMRAWIEDVAAQAGAKTVDLTSRPSREAANRLYVRVGFEKRETNIYRYKIEQKK
jgi:hypothetical protein